MTEQARYQLHKLQRKYLLFRLTEIVLQSLGLVLVVYSMLDWIRPEATSTKIIVSIFSGVGLLTALFLYYKLHRLNNKLFTQFLNQNFPQLSESADLMLFDQPELTSLQQLQRIKTSIKLPQRVVRSFVVLCASCLVYFITSSFSASRKTNLTHLVTAEKIQDLNRGVQSVTILSVSIAVTPPEYTGLKLFRSNDFDLHFPEGSKVRWTIEFSGKPKGVKLFFSGRDSVNIKLDKNYTFENNFFESGFYQIQWSDSGGVHRSDYYPLDVIKDLPPKVELKNLQQYTKLKYTDLHSLTVNSTLSDDYSVTEAILIATVSKGSGESVKFREEKLHFTSPQKISGKNIVASRSLDLKKLGLEPGDELYFYAEAWDNKIPAPNHSRTETFFIAVQDTSTEITSADGGLGVDLMPEYFRSQRQIIMDTEKLLRDRRHIAKQEFNATSNELGYDQKILRLRYGLFLGEEDEAGIGQEAAQADESEQDVTKQFGHAHDTNNEHNLVDQKKDHHERELKNPEEKEDPVKAFTHNHDNSEESTFFIQSLKAKLKAAVTMMWDAELYLRLYEPEKSLPYQYKALNLLKEISNDPPTLKEDKRLTADLSEIRTNTIANHNNSGKDYPAIRLALIIIEKMLTENDNTVSEANRITLSKAGQELSMEAIENPLIYLKSLSLLKSLVDGQLSPGPMHDDLSQIRKSLWEVLPHQASSPHKRTASSMKLDEEFLRSLAKIRND